MHILKTISSNDDYKTLCSNKIMNFFERSWLSSLITIQNDSNFSKVYTALF